MPVKVVVRQLNAEKEKVSARVQLVVTAPILWLAAWWGSFELGTLFAYTFLIDGSSQDGYGAGTAFVGIMMVLPAGFVVSVVVSFLVWVTSDNSRRAWWALGNIPILRDESAEARSRVGARFRIGSSCP